MRFSQVAVVGAVAEDVESVTDAQAIERSLTDPSAFVSVFERHFALLHRYLRARTGESSADDLASQTFEVAFRRRADYDLAFPDARPWLFGIAFNLLREERRQEHTHQRTLARLHPREADLDPQFERIEARAGAMSAALTDVPDADRDLLLLYACVGLSYDECAAALGVPVGTVRSRLHRLRARLRARLDREREASA